MIIGCFALIEPFSGIDRQFELIRAMGFDYADVTDNHTGATLGVEFGFSASISLESHPADVRAAAAKHRITLTSVCAHANLLDPTSPARYGTREIIAAIRLAQLLGIKQVITTEGDARTDFGHGLSRSEALVVIREKLYEPIRWAREFGIELLLEPHGKLTDTVDGMKAILDALDDSVGINLDTGNSWLGGGDPLAFVKTFGKRIKHVHWKDMPADWASKRGKIFGCGMGSIPLGDGIVGIRAIVDALQEIGFTGPTTLEVAGAQVVKQSAECLRKWSD